MRLLRKKASKRSTSAKNAHVAYPHHWDHPKAYTIALLLIIGLLAAPIYTGMAVKENNEPVISATKDMCSDTDGRNYDVKGTVKALNSGESYSFEDSCSGNVLKEYYCNGDRMASALQKCANGCNEGRCR